MGHGFLKTRIVIAFAIGFCCLIAMVRDYPFNPGASGWGSLLFDGLLLAIALIAFFDAARGVIRLGRPNED